MLFLNVRDTHVLTLGLQNARSTTTFDTVQNLQEEKLNILGACIIFDNETSGVKRIILMYGY